MQDKEDNGNQPSSKNGKPNEDERHETKVVPADNHRLRKWLKWGLLAAATAFIYIVVDWCSGPLIRYLPHPLDRAGVNITALSLGIYEHNSDDFPRIELEFYAKNESHERTTVVFDSLRFTGVDRIVNLAHRPKTIELEKQGARWDKLIADDSALLTWLAVPPNPANTHFVAYYTNLGSARRDSIVILDSLVRKCAYFVITDVELVPTEQRRHLQGGPYDITVYMSKNGVSQKPVTRVSEPLFFDAHTLSYLAFADLRTWLDPFSPSTNIGMRAFAERYGGLYIAKTDTGSGEKLDIRGPEELLGDLSQYDTEELFGLDLSIPWTSVQSFVYFSLSSEVLGSAGQLNGRSNTYLIEVVFEDSLIGKKAVRTLDSLGYLVGWRQAAPMKFISDLAFHELSEDEHYRFVRFLESRRSDLNAALSAGGNVILQLEDHDTADVISMCEALLTANDTFATRCCVLEFDIGRVSVRPPGMPFARTRFLLTGFDAQTRNTVLDSFTVGYTRNIAP